VKDDASLNDEQLEGEIRLVGDLVLAASQREGHLSEAEIDAVLGLEPEASDDDASDGDASDDDASDDDGLDEVAASHAADLLPPGSKAS